MSGVIVDIRNMKREFTMGAEIAVFVTHEPDIASFSKRTITLRDGKTIQDSINMNVRSAKAVLESLPPVDLLSTETK
ncbi:hypothetical protein A4D02_34895 [Niastella koreensis]|uniref:ABC transporter ATP-binding protein n=1 Tax=Niastella koreensis TaxID=354356 RepID=A0ABX3NSA6_9BACT|nr:hypothetical protein [Niastella koreensis]OQP44414.1 hypothetical protein A4D02_34895 [Niastella koreensis]